MQDLSKAYSARKKKTPGKLPVSKKRKPIKQKGKRTIEYEKWRDTVAKPYLDRTFGRRCADCGSADNLTIDHIITRGSRPDLVKELSNIQYLCGDCHRDKTDHLGKYKRENKWQELEKVAARLGASAE